MLGTGGGGRAAGGAISMVMLGFLAAPTFGVIFFMAIWGLIAHGLLRMTGNTASGIGRTYQAIGFSSGANIFTAVPCLSFYIAPIGWIWWAVSTVLMLQEGQKVSGPRAAFAGLTAPLLAMIVIIGGMWLFFMTAMTGMTTAMNSMTNSSQFAVTSITQALIIHASNDNGQGPDHAARLLISDAQTVTATDFHAQLSNTDLAKIPVGKQLLFELEYLDSDKQTLAVQAAADALPDNIVAHRLADLVFTYHGIDLNNADPNLWLIITSNDPDSPVATIQININKTITVGKADGSTMDYGSTLFPKMLIQQNKLRQSLNLPPIPDPALVTHAKPATAP